MLEEAQESDGGREGGTALEIPSARAWSHSCSYLLSPSVSSSHFLFPFPHVHSPDTSGGKKAPLSSQGTLWGSLTPPSRPHRV